LLFFVIFHSYEVQLIIPFSFSLSKLKWKATKGLDEMCEDLWRWQSSNPNGFESK